MKLRDKFWLWGHPEGRYNNEFGNNGISRMTPMECCLYLGIKNTFMVPVGWDVSMRKYNKSFNGSLTNEDTWKLIGISKTSFYKYKEELLAEQVFKLNS